MTRILPIACAVFLLSGCSSDNDDDPSEGSSAPPARGTLVQNPPARLISVPATQLFANLGGGPLAEQLLALFGAPECDVDVHQLRYNTVDFSNRAIVGSGALMIPTGADPACQGGRPIVVYDHGTVVEQSFNIANLTDERNVEGVLIAAAFAAQGYVVVAPNYVGFDASAGAPHAFLNADQQSKDTVDALAAARSALPTSFAPTVTDNGKLFVTGYSQGGYVALATHRLLQSTGSPITASAPMSGPYALSAFGDAVVYGQVVRSAPLFFTYLATGYERAYGDIYASPTDVFEARYATGIDTLLPTAGSRSDLFAQGRLPGDQLFSSIPPDPSLAPYTPATEPADLAAVFARGFGAENLVTNSFRLTYIQDAQANPDGAFPTLTDGRPPANPMNGLRRAFKANDLRNWSPMAPVLLCGGADDPTVLFMNTQLMQNHWTANGPTGPVKVLDVDGDPVLGDPDARLQTGFDIAKAAIAADAVAGGATDGGAGAVLDAYHGELVPPFCLGAVRAFFDAL